MNQAILSLALVAFAGHVTKGDDQAMLDLSSATTTFSQELYQRIALDKPDVIYSPYSIHSCLTMTSLGARGDTANEMARTLQLTSQNLSDPHDTYRDLIMQLNSATNVKLNTANGIFTNPNQPVESDFVNEVTQKYLATTDTFDLTAQEGPEKSINDYIANKTEDMITNILPRGSINGNTVMLLVNTIFFNGSWASPFPKYKTHKSNFTQLNGDASEVDMMHDAKWVSVKYDVTNGVDVVEIPFRGRRFGLYIALPRQVDGITALEKFLATPGRVEQLLEGLSHKRVQLTIPKFKIESSVELSSSLQDMGMRKAFCPFTADFSGISSADQVYISKVLHKAVIDVQESGTVASAATSVAITALVHPMPPKDVFVANHPFIFFLRDNQTKQILFQGKFSG